MNEVDIQVGPRILPLTARPRGRLAPTWADGHTVSLVGQGCGQGLVWETLETQCLFMAHSRGGLMDRQLASVPPHGPHGLWLDTRSNMIGMDILGTVAAARIHRSFLSLGPKFWERLFRTPSVREGAQGHV